MRITEAGRSRIISCLVAAALTAVVIASCGAAETTSQSAVIAPSGRSLSGEEASDPDAVLQTVRDGLGMRFKVSASEPGSDEESALAAIGEHYDIEAYGIDTESMLLVETISASEHPHLNPGRLIYLVYRTGLDQVEYGPVNADGGATEILVDKAVFPVDAVDGTFIQASYWE